MIDNLSTIATKYNKSVEYINRQNFKKAQQLLRECLDEYEFKEGLVNLGNCYRHFGQDKKMFECYTKANSPEVPHLLGQSTGDYTHALNNLGLAYFMYGNDTAAIDCYDRCLAIEPKFNDSIWNKSTAVLRQACSGREDLFPLGWQLYDARFLKTPPVKLKNKREDLVFWDFTSHVDALIVLVEQGIGDFLMWGRYFATLLQYCDKLYVQCDPSLECFVPDFATPVRDAADVEVKFAVPLCSIAKLTDKIPPGNWLEGKFGVREFNEENFNIGIVWSGSSGHANNAYRSVPVHRFHNLARYANLYSLTPGVKSTKYVKSLGINSWVDTAEYVNGLDLVISVDTSVVHLCGSLGRECWMIQPFKETDFRWGNRTDSKNVWYDSVRVFHNPQDWNFVFEQVLDALKERLYC